MKKSKLSNSLLLDEIKTPKDVKQLKKEELAKLCDEVRNFMIDKVSKTGGH